MKGFPFVIHIIEPQNVEQVHFTHNTSRKLVKDNLRYDGDADDEDDSGFDDLPNLGPKAENLYKNKTGTTF